MQVFELPQTESKPQSVGFSPDGRFLAAWEETRVYAIDTATGTARVLWSGGGKYSYCTPGIGFMADGRRVVALHIPGGGTGKVLQVHDTKTAKSARTNLRMDVWAMDVGANGLVVLAGWSWANSLRVELWDTRTDRRRLAVIWPVGFPEVVASSADGRWVAGSCVDLVRLWNLPGNGSAKRARRQFRVVDNKTVRALAVSASGEFVAATSDRLYVWDVRTGKEARVANVSPGRGRKIAFHPSQPILAFGTGKGVCFWDVTAKAEMRRFAWDVGHVNAVAFAPDGLRCAAAGTGKVVIWDVDA